MLREKLVAFLVAWPLVLLPSELVASVVFDQAWHAIHGCWMFQQRYGATLLSSPVEACAGAGGLRAFHLTLLATAVAAALIAGWLLWRSGKGASAPDS